MSTTVKFATVEKAVKFEGYLTAHKFWGKTIWGFTLDAAGTTLVIKGLKTVVNDVLRAYQA